MGHSYSYLFGFLFALFFGFFFLFLNVSWFTFPAGKKVVRNLGAEARGARRAGAGLTAAGSLQWVESNEVARKFLPLWPSSPPHLLFFFFFSLWKGTTVSERKKGAFFSLFLPPFLSILIQSSHGSPQVSCVPMGIAREQHWSPRAKPPCNSQLDRKSRGGLAQNLSLHPVLGTPMSIH